MRYSQETLKTKNDMVHLTSQISNKVKIWRSLLKSSIDCHGWAQFSQELDDTADVEQINLQICSWEDPELIFVAFSS